MKRKPFERILTTEDIALILELREWKQAEIARIHAAASNAALAEKFGVSVRAIENTIAKWG